MNKIKLSVLSIVCPAMLAFGQNGPEADEEEDVFELSPFVVQAEEDVGYRSTATLAGTRIKTDLKDVAASVSSYTKEFLDDLGATNAEELLVFATGAEVGGLGGNLTVNRVSGQGLDFTLGTLELNSATRVRGLAAADNTRGFFQSIIPMDSYNTDRVTVNRGANNILFGLGSPAGIIDRSLSQAGGDRTRLKIRMDKFGSLRTELDVGRQIIEDKLALRLIALSEQKEYEQTSAFNDQERFYLTADYSPWKNGKIVASYETGEGEGSNPSVAPPRDEFSYWWEIGQPTVPAGQAAGNGFIAVDGQNLRYFDLLVANPPRGPASAYMPGELDSSYGFIALPAGQGLFGPRVTAEHPQYDVIAANKRGNYNMRNLALVGLSRYNRNTAKNPYATWMQTTQILDRSVFDYRTEKLTGNNDRRTFDFDAVNASFQQSFFENQLGFDLTFDKQSVDHGNINFGGFSFRSNNLGIDLTPHLIDGSDNPGFGRAFIAVRPRWQDRTDEIETSRFTAYAKFLGEQVLGDNGKWLGDHVFTFLADKSDREQTRLQGNMQTYRPDLSGPAGHNAASGTVVNGLSATHVHYISEPLFGLAGPEGLGLEGILDDVPYRTESTITYTDVATRTLQTGTFPMSNYFTDRDYSVYIADMMRSSTESLALAWQASWFDTLITTAGWRDDSFEEWAPGQPTPDVFGTRSLNAPGYGYADVPDTDEQKDTFSFGTVLHAPESIDKLLPEFLDLSLHYNESENFKPSSPTRNPFGGFFPSQEGTSTDYGFSATFNDRLTFKATWYETSQDNVADADIVGFYNQFFSLLPEQVVENNTAAEITAANYPLPDPRILESIGWTVTPDPNGGLPSVTTNQSVGDITSVVSKGVEFELVGQITDSWNISFNASQQEAVKTGIGQTAADELLRLGNAIIDQPAGQLLGNGGNPIEGAMTNRFAAFKTHLLGEGTLTQNLVEWRANLVNSYRFKDGKFKGLGLGAGLRWQDAPAIGYEIKGDPTVPGGLYQDPNSPVFGDESFFTDVWVSYPVEIGETKVKLQLNVKNLFDDNILLPVHRNPVEAFEGTYAAESIGTHSDIYRLYGGREVFLTATFDF
ncbi:TonB-dependent receptor plug domain-containing protein [Pelagicoccus mobilis]|uniref:TonB-dependent receptor plug domain-containing protein n=1 Tax=Pelagicoccus mobilis TaxID=415221 RepID=A0A934RUT7_9BACT|nr:TonB-dependent receptor plug domain-containing protein [Pelagicoccus mobilis]MBK1877232.1 TonB-dependent receptor plug domain-containing protein [Pelagicoccus mobilis]